MLGLLTLKGKSGRGMPQVCTATLYPVVQSKTPL